jgi:hypothetical protein
MPRIGRNIRVARVPRSRNARVRAHIATPALAFRERRRIRSVIRPGAFPTAESTLNYEPKLPLSPLLRR